MANGTMIKIIAGSGLGMVTTVMAFMGNGIVENDRRNTTEHTQIRKEISAGIIDIKDEVSELNGEQREQRAILDRIEKKL